MAYKVVVTEHAEELLDRLVYHLLYGLKNGKLIGKEMAGICRTDTIWRKDYDES